MLTEFNPSPPTVMHVDINSCFATIEQQANPRLRGVPTVVAAYVQDHGCILAASREAKKLGIGTGMRVWEAKKIMPRVVVLPPDPDKYRVVNRQLLAILSGFTPDVSVQSIDEMVMDLKNSANLRLEGRNWNLENQPSTIQLQGLASRFKLLSSKEDRVVLAMIVIGQEIKTRIKQEIGEWMTVSVGIAPNRYLAKVASGIQKPDGLVAITRQNIHDVLGKLKLEDLCGIKNGNANRLRIGGIYTPLAMLLAPAGALERAFHSIVGYHWWMRLHGYEDGSLYKAFGAPEEAQKTFGQSYALGWPFVPQSRQLHQILAQLVTKMGRRLRRAGATAGDVGVSTLFGDWSHWQKRTLFGQQLYADGDLYKRAKDMLLLAPERSVRILAVYTGHVQYNLYDQQSLLEEDCKKKQLTQALDAVSDRWGEFVVMPGRMLGMQQWVLDRIAFGKVRDLDSVAVP